MLKSQSALGLRTVQVEILIRPYDHVPVIASNKVPQIIQFKKTAMFSRKK